MNKKLGVVGCGNMGTAVIHGLQRGEEAWDIVVYDISREALNKVSSQFTVTVCDSVEGLVDICSICLLAVKPQDIFSVLRHISSRLNQDKLVISIAAGISTSLISDIVGDESEVPVVRAMPNTPALVGAGITTLCAGKHVGNEQVSTARKIFSTLGEVLVIEKESYMDTVTALSGSGPAFIFLVAEALSDAGVKMGLPRKISNTLSVMAILGAGSLLKEMGTHPAQLKDMVTSPGGTTIEGLYKLEKAGVRGAVMSAVEASTLRSIEIGIDIMSKQMGGV